MDEFILRSCISFSTKLACLPLLPTSDGELSLLTKKEAVTSEKMPLQDLLKANSCAQSEFFNLNFAQRNVLQNATKNTLNFKNFVRLRKKYEKVTVLPVLR